MVSGYIASYIAREHRFAVGTTEKMNFTLAPDSRAGGGAPEMGSRLSTLVTCGFGVRTSLEANRLSCPRSADTALKPYLTLPTEKNVWPEYS